MSKKTVSFNENIEIHETYNSDEYDRQVIDYVLYRKAYNKITNEEFNAIFVNLDLYKLYEMLIHKDSLHNNSYNNKKFSILF